MIEGQEIWKVLDYYGAEMTPDSGGWQPMKCPYHDDSRASARVNPDEGCYACLGCGERGDALSLIMRRENVDFTGATAIYEKITGGALPPLHHTTPRQSSRRVLGQERDHARDSGTISDRIRRRPRPG